MKKIKMLANIKYLLQKEFIQIFRNKTILRMIVALPVLQLLILPWAATFEQKNISLSVVDHAHDSYSRLLIGKVISTGYFKLADYSASYGEALTALEQDKVDLILEIPRDFEKKMIREQQTDLMLSVNAVNGQKAGLGASYIARIINDFNREIISRQITGEASAGQINIVPNFRYNVQMNYRNFMVPGILVILMTVIGGMLSTLNIVREKEIGTIEQINVTPVSKAAFILAKLIPFWVIGIFLLTIGMFIAWLVYGIFPTGNILALYVYTLIYLFAFTGFGLIISNYSATQQQAMFVLFFFMLIFFLLSGLLTPIKSMPGWAQILTYFNPVRYFIEVVRLVYMKGGSFANILPQIGMTVLFAIVLNIWAIISYKKTNG